MKTKLQRLFLLLMLLPLCAAASAAIGRVSKDNSKITKTDVGGTELSSITLTVTLGADEQPNGMAMLRQGKDLDKLVNNGANFLVDGVLTKARTAPGATSSTWTITWKNVPEGNYKVFFKQSGGTEKTDLGQVTIDELPEPSKPVPPTVTFDVENVTCKEKGSITINISGGIPKFKISGNVYYNNGNVKSALPIESATRLRAHKVPNLEEGEYIKVTVIDDNGHKTTELTSPKVGSSSIKVYHEQNIHLIQTGDCTFDRYLMFTIENTGSDKDAVEKQTQLLIKTFRLWDWRRAHKFYTLEYAPAFNRTHENKHYRYFRVIDIDKAADFEYYNLDYETLCQGKIEAKGKSWNPYNGVRRLADMMHIKTSVSADVDPNNCEYANAKYTVTYDFLGENNGQRSWLTSFYYLLNDNAHKYARIYKKNKNGTYDSTPVKTDVPMPTDPFRLDYSGMSFTLNEPGEYKFVYGSPDCQKTYVNRVFVVEAPKPNFVEYTKFYTDKTIDPKLGIHGNTAGLRIKMENVVAPLKFTLLRPDGKSDFVVTDFADDKEYTTKILFPQEIVYKENNPNGFFFGDLPAGDYILWVEDKCMHKANYKFTIKEENLQKFKPKRDGGFKDGVYVGPDCEGKNVVKFDFGPKASTIAYGYKTKDGAEGHRTGKDWTSEKDGIFNKEDIKLVGTNYFRVSYGPTLYNADGVNKTENYVYSAIAREGRTYNYAINMDINKKRDYDYVPYKFDFDDIAGEQAFDVFGTMCDVNSNSSGVIAVDSKRGVNIKVSEQQPVTYELYTADSNGNVGNNASPLKTHKTINPAQLSCVWNGLPKGFYVVKTSYGKGCSAKKLVEVNASGLPDPVYYDKDTKKIAKEITIDIGVGMKPLAMALPVSTSVYDVKWIDITNNPNNNTPLPGGTGNEFYATFTKPGNYTYRVQTNFTGTSGCQGSSGGHKDIVFHVTKKNFWLGATNTCFNEPTNWTAYEVPEHGEDIIFATQENYGRDAMNDCRLENLEYGNLYPHMFQARKLDNHSPKAMVIPADGSLTISDAAGLEHQNGDPVRLKIEASKDLPNGVFIYQNAPKEAKVFAEVEMYVRSTKLATPTTWKDNIPESPTFGQRLKVEHTDQFFGVPFQRTSSGWLTNSKIYKYDEKTNDKNRFYQKFTGLKAGEMMTGFAGYSIRSMASEPVVKRMRGYLCLGNTKLTVTRKAAKAVDKETHGMSNDELLRIHWGLGQNLFGNSYTAPLLITGIKFPEELEKTVYLYKTGSVKDWGDNDNEDKYTMWDPIPDGTYLAIPVKATGDAAIEAIPSMQGFLVKFTEEETKINGSDVTIELDYNELIGNYYRQQMSKPAAPTESTNRGSVRFVLTGKQADGKQVGDVMWLIEQPGTSDAFDNGWDGLKLGAEMLNTAMYSQTRSNKLMVNTSESLTKANITLAFGDKGDYTLKLKRKQLPHYPDLKLVDDVAKQVLPFDGDTLTYHFTSDAVTAAKRFRLVNTTATTYEGVTNGISSTQSELSGEATVYQLSGEMVGRVNLPKDMESLKARLRPGVYIISMKKGNETINQKLVIKK